MTEAQIVDLILFGLWAVLASCCILNWTAQARWHKYYRGALEQRGPLSADQMKEKP